MDQEHRWPSHTQGPCHCPLVEIMRTQCELKTRATLLTVCIFMWQGCCQSNRVAGQLSNSDKAPFPHWEGTCPNLKLGYRLSTSSRTDLDKLPLKLHGLQEKAHPEISKRTTIPDSEPCRLRGLPGDPGINRYEARILTNSLIPTHTMLPQPKPSLYLRLSLTKQTKGSTCSLQIC